MSGIREVGWSNAFGHKGPCQPTRVEHLHDLQLYLDEVVKPHLDRQDEKMAAYHDMFDAEKRFPDGDVKRQRYIQDVIKIEKLRWRGLLRQVADQYVKMDSWDKESKEKVYEAVERYVYGVDEILRLPKRGKNEERE